jgi:hypothetical protein
MWGDGGGSEFSDSDDGSRPEKVWSPPRGLVA